MNPQQALLQISTWIDNHRLPYYGLRDNYYQWSNTVNTVNIFISLDEFYKLNNHINNIFNIINMPPTTNVSRLLQIAKFNMEAKWANTHTHKHTHTPTHTHTDLRHKNNDLSWSRLSQNLCSNPFGTEDRWISSYIKS